MEIVIFGVSIVMKNLKILLCQQRQKMPLSNFLKEKLQSGKYKYLSVGWFGGEPLLGYKTIKRLSPVFIDLCEKYQIHYQSAITTNGYLLTKNKFRYLNEN